MHINFTNNRMGVETFSLELTIGNQTQSQLLQTIPLIAYQEFQNLMAQVANDPRPCKIKISTRVEFWSDMEQAFKSHVNSMEFKNKVYGDKAST